MGWKVISKKKLWSTDVSARHNRILLRRDDVRSNILPLLPQCERDAVGEAITLKIRSASTGKKYRVKFAYWSSMKGYVFHGKGWADFRKDVALEKKKDGVLVLLAMCTDDHDDDNNNEDQRRFSSMTMDRAADEEAMGAAEVLFSFRNPIFFG